MTKSLQQEQAHAATLTRGSRLYFVTGAGYAPIEATVTSVELNFEWGPRVMVRLADFTTTQISRLVGTVTEVEPGWFEGDDQGIGAYAVAA